jgi:hypothetical protein
LEAFESRAFLLPSGVWSDQHVATLLYRIGRWAGQDEDLSMPGTASQKAFGLLDERR